MRRNEDAKRKMAADLKTKLQEKERGKLINPLDEIFRCRPANPGLNEYKNKLSYSIRNNTSKYYRGNHTRTAKRF